MLTPPLLSYRANTEDLIGKYEEELDKFMRSTTVAQFKDMLPASTSLAMMETVIMRLQNYWEESTLSNLKVFIQTLGIPDNHLHLSSVSKNSIIVHWLCPTDKVPELEKAISATAKELLAGGVEQIYIGDKCVLDPAKGIVIILLIVFSSSFSHKIT